MARRESTSALPEASGERFMGDVPCALREQVRKTLGGGAAHELRLLLHVNFCVWPANAICAPVESILPHVGS